MPNKSYSTKYFLSNEYFLQWVKAPNAENNAYWQEFIHIHPEDKGSIEKAKKLIQQLDFYVEPRGAATKRRVKENIDKVIQENASQKVLSFPERPVIEQKELPSINIKKWMNIAATLTGLLLLLGTYLILVNDDSTTYVTDYAETKTFILPDNSVVTLNANSTLRLTGDNWRKTSERKVWLEGEAFFEVEKRKSRQGEPVKFVVHSEGLKIEVLGTKFNVKARHQETKVVLSSGSVKLNLQQEKEKAETEIMMEPGDMVSVSKDNRNVVKKIVNTSYYTSWKKNKLIFDHTPIADIKQLIEDNYGLKVCIKSDSLLGRNFTGAAPADNLDILLNKISIVYNLNIIRKDKKILIKDK